MMTLTITTAIPTGVTAHFPEGIYHYHITADLPWINGGEFYGVAGKVTQ